MIFLGVHFTSYSELKFGFGSFVESVKHATTRRCVCKPKVIFSTTLTSYLVDPLFSPHPQFVDIHEVHKFCKKDLTNVYGALYTRGLGPWPIEPHGTYLFG